MLGFLILINTQNRLAAPNFTENITKETEKPMCCFKQARPAFCPTKARAAAPI